MISLVGLHRNLFRIFDMAQANGLTVHVAYKRREYVLDISPTGKIVPHSLGGTKIREAARKKAVSIRLGDCQRCGKLLVAGRCIDRDCDKLQKEEIKKQGI